MSDQQTATPEAPATPPVDDHESVAVEPPTVPPKKSAPPRRRRSSSSLFAKGEPMIWLTGGAMLTCLIMVIGLLALIFYFGGSTFWPDPVVKITTVDGRTYMGEITRSDNYQPEPTAIESLSGELRTLAESEMAAHDGWAHRQLFRTGNFRLTQTHFQWINDYEIATTEHPDWAVTVERMEWGRYYGFPEAFVLITNPLEGPADQRKQEAVKLLSEFKPQNDGVGRVLIEANLDGRMQPKLIGPDQLDQLDKAPKIHGVVEAFEGAESAWAAFNRYHEDVRNRWQQRRDLEKYDIGHVNHEQESARLAMREAELDLQDAVNTSGEDSPQAEEARKALAAAREHHEKVSAHANEQFAEIREKIKSINAENARYQLLMRTAGEGKQAAIASLMRLDDVVRGYPANRLSFGDKLSINASRWWEFLFDEPREANSEGGVWPAIFGTVVMTMIMAIAVVPFGVLAALYIREYAKGGFVVSVVRIAINNLAGVPSIVFGVFGLGFFCYQVGGFVDGGPKNIGMQPMTPLGWWLVLSGVVVVGTGAFFCWLSSARMSKSRLEQRSLQKLLRRGSVVLWLTCLSGAMMLIVKIPYFDGLYRASLPNPVFGKGGLLWASFTLALLTLPVVIVATEEALAAVPGSMREGSYACGASKWQTIHRIVLPRAMPGIMTGAILSMARGAGEVAPLMLVGAVKLAPELPVDGVFPYVHMQRSFMHLGFHIYDVGFQSQNSEAAKPMVYTTTLLLILIVAVLNLTAIYLRTRLRRKFVANQF